MKENGFHLQAPLSNLHWIRLYCSSPSPPTHHWDWEEDVSVSENQGSSLLSFSFFGSLSNLKISWCSSEILTVRSICSRRITTYGKSNPIRRSSSKIRSKITTKLWLDFYQFWVGFKGNRIGKKREGEKGEHFGANFVAKQNN